MEQLTFVIGFFIVGTLLTYFLGGYYLREYFEDKMPPNYDTVAQYTGENGQQQPQWPYTSDTPPMDDFEYSLVYQQEGSREASKKEISDAMSRYPLSWTNRPPSDERFQTYRADYEAAKAAEPVPAAEPSRFKSISGADMTPPDMTAQEEAEKAILAMYKPEKAVNLTHYNLEDAKNLVKKIYAKRGLIADIEPSKQGGPNVFEIVETRPIHEKIVWEDEVQRDPVERYKLRGEEQITVPQQATDIAAGLDPFYEPRQTTRMGRSDYTQWTSGLERQFAPTYVQQN